MCRHMYRLDGVDVVGHLHGVFPPHKIYRFRCAECWIKAYVGYDTFWRTNGYKKLEQIPGT